MIVVYISDARDEYARTIFEKVGLPAGTRAKLRYSDKWISSPLRTGIHENQLTGSSVLLCYLEGNRGNLTSARAVPCRYARIIKSERISDFVGIDCELLGFPGSAKLADLISSADANGIVHPGPRSGSFITNVDVPIPDSLEDVTADRWGVIVHELSTCAFFKDASFVYCEKLTSSHDRQIACRNGAFPINGGTLFTARIHTYAITKESRLHDYALRVDSSAVEMIDGSQISVAFGREFFDVQFSALPTDRIRPARIRLEPGPGENGTFFVLSVEILNRRLGTALRRGSIALSGAAAATAGILPDSAPIALRIVLLAAGSIGLGLSARPSS